jgi:hypothetical protein
MRGGDSSHFPHANKLEEAFRKTRKLVVGLVVQLKDGRVGAGGVGGAGGGGGGGGGGGAGGPLGYLDLNATWVLALGRCQAEMPRQLSPGLSGRDLPRQRTRPRRCAQL